MTPNQQPSLFRRPALIVISGFLLALIVLPAISNAAFQEPATNPPKYDTTLLPELINVTGSASVFQQKAGSLLIGPLDATKCDITIPNATDDNTGCAKLCLNPDLTTFPGVTDTTNCILSWKDLAAPVSGFLKKFDGTSTSLTTLPPYGNAINTSTATVDTGYIGWQANPSGGTQSQLFSFIAETPSGTENTSPGTIRPAAIRAEGDTNSYFAGEFLGTLGVVGLGAGVPRLCLNDQGGGGSCISRWSDITALANPQIVTLQDVHRSQYVVDQGHTSAAGGIVAGSLVAGQAQATALGLYSCGDNICQSMVETLATCPTDCQP